MFDVEMFEEQAVAMTKVYKNYYQMLELVSFFSGNLEKKLTINLVQTLSKMNLRKIKVKKGDNINL